MFRMPLEAFTQDESFPFFIQYGEHEESMYLHGHDAYLELVIVLSGSATHIVDNERYPAFFEWKGQRYRLAVTRMDEGVSTESDHLNRFSGSRP